MDALSQETIATLGMGVVVAGFSGVCTGTSPAFAIAFRGSKVCTRGCATRSRDCATRSIDLNSGSIGLNGDSTSGLTTGSRRRPPRLRPHQQTRSRQEVIR